MKILQKICFVLLLTTFSSVYAGSCFDDVSDVDDCKVRADQGHSSAQYNLGLMYAEGKGITQNYKEAVKWYRKSAEQGHSTAQASLGWLYYTGKGVPRDYKEAFQWCKKSSDQGDADAQSILGIMYAKGEGVDQDSAKTYGYWTIAAGSGDDNDMLKNRDAFAERMKMTPSQIEEGQELAREWIRRYQ